MIPLCPWVKCLPKSLLHRSLQKGSSKTTAMLLEGQLCRSVLTEPLFLRMDLQDICTECGGCDLLRVPVEVALSLQSCLVAKT